MKIESSTSHRNINDEYIIGQIIARGESSTISECIHRITGISCAVKSVLKADFAQSSSLNAEMKILRGTSHSNVIKLVDYFEDHDYMFMVLELVKGDLFSQIIEKQYFDEEECFRYLYQIISGVRYLHSVGIVHRDLKLENILLTGDHLFISDFGLSKTLYPSDMGIMKTRCGSPIYVAPEVLEGKGYTKAVDVWSIGVILYTMCYGRFPYLANSLHELYQLIHESELDMPFDIDVSFQLMDLICAMLTVDPSKRITLDQIFTHPWITKHMESTNLSTTSKEGPNDVKQPMILVPAS